MSTLRFVAINHHVESGIARLAHRRHQVRPRYGADLRPDEDAGAPLLVALLKAAFGADELARPADAGSTQHNPGVSIMGVTLGNVDKILLYTRGNWRDRVLDGLCKAGLPD